MTHDNMITGTMGDKEALSDCIASQKHASSAYNTFVGECVNEQLRKEFMCILEDEHNIQAELFTEANSRGWYPVRPADQSMVTQAKQKYTLG